MKRQIILKFDHGHLETRSSGDGVTPQTAQYADMQIIAMALTSLGLNINMPLEEIQGIIRTQYGTIQAGVNHYEPVEQKLIPTEK